MDQGSKEGRQITTGYRTKFLMIVEGISSANNLTSFRRRPVQLSTPYRLGSSAHVSRWSGQRSYSQIPDEAMRHLQRRWKQTASILMEENLARARGITIWSIDVVPFLDKIGADRGCWPLFAQKKSKGKEKIRAWWRGGTGRECAGVIRAVEFSRSLRLRQPVRCVE